MFEPSKGTGFIDIQDGDAISESSDTEIVAHTKEQIQYGNQATSSESNSDSDVNDGPPPLNSDEDDDDGSDVDGIGGPPPLDSDDNAENTDDGEELLTSPDTGSREELSHNRVHLQNKRRGVKSSEDSESDSDSESGVKEAPPPLDSEDDDEENEVSNPNAENVESANVGSVESYTHDSPVEEVGNDDDNNDNDDDDNDNDDEQHIDNNEDVGDHDEKEEEEEEQEEEQPQAVPHSTEFVAPENENSEESEQSDSPAEAEKQIPLQNQSDDSDDGIVDEKGSDHEAALDSVEEVHAASVADVVSSSALPEEDSHEDEQEDNEEADVTEDAAISSELNEKQIAVHESADHDHIHDQPVSFSKKEGPDYDSDQDSGDSPEFLPIEDENELEWDVEDFDMPPQKSVNKTSKINAEGLEIDKLKKSFLDTLKSEAEQTKVVETQQKAEPKKKEKVDKGLNAKSTLKDEKKRVHDKSKNATNQDLKSEQGKYPKKVAKDTQAKPEQVKAEKKSVKDEVKNTSKNLTTTKPVDTSKKPVKAKAKSTDKSVDKTDIKQKTEKQRKDIKESQRITEAPSVERKSVAKAGRVKSALASSLQSGASEQQRGAVEQQRGQQTLPTKEKKKTRPASDLHVPTHSHSHLKHKEEAHLPSSQTKKDVKKPRKSDSDSTSDSLTKQKPQKTSSSESVSRQKKPSPAVVTSHKEKEKPAENAEVRKTKTKRTASKPVAVGIDHEDAVNHERKRHSDVHVAAKNSADVSVAKPRSRPTSNGHLSSSQEKLSSHSGRHDHGARDHSSHKHSGHAHDRSKHVWLCRDDEIHKLIAQKASLLKEYESGSLAGRKVCK